MWERIGASSGVIVGAIVLFAAFVFILFLFEHYDKKAQRKKRRAPYLLPPIEKKAASHGASLAHSKRHIKPSVAKKSPGTLLDIRERKIG